MKKVRSVRRSAGTPAQKYKKTLWKLHAHRLCSLVAHDIALVDVRAEVRPPLLMSPSREIEREHKLSRARQALLLAWLEGKSCCCWFWGPPRRAV